MESPSGKNNGSDFHKNIKRYVPDEDLRDIPARLFRKIIQKHNINLSKWTCLLRDYLLWTIPNDDPEKVKSERSTAAGNIKSAYFMSPTLTFNKLIEGMSILKFVKCKVTLELTDGEGNVTEVSDTIKIRSPKNQENKT